VATLFVLRGNDHGAIFELSGPICTVGRDASNSIQLHDQEVSRNHAQLHCDDQRFILKDLGSSNGTYVNSKRVETHELASGDQVQMGKTLLLFTGPTEDSGQDLSDRVHIVTPERSDNSRIVESMGQDVSSQILGMGTTASETSWLARARSNLQIMYRTALAVSHTLDIDQLLTRILQLIFEWVEADRGCIMLIDRDTGGLVPKAHLSRKGRPSKDEITISQTILDYVLARNEGVLTSNAQQDDRWNPAASIMQQGVREAICVPMQGRYDVVGVIYIDTSTTPQQMIQLGKPANRFTSEHLKLMIAIAHQAALAVEDTRYYSAMVQSERLAAIGQTIATLSHHIKNILQGIRGGSYLIKDGLAKHDESQVQKGWQFVEKNQERISNLVMDMLTFSKEREPEMIPADLNTVVAEVVELVQARAAEAGVQIAWNPDPNVPRATFDPEGIHRAVLNVATNAIDACLELPEGDAAPRPRRVKIFTEFDPSTSRLRIVVEDNGVGIPPDELDKIFGLFVSKKRSRGTGLGLAVSQKIVKEHGGQINVESDVGRGSRFALEIPAMPVEAASDPPAVQTKAE
jgi:signal transduction histidine kinase/pSer/pThr/pTyr-binding forkhead associated (FHA) protein